MGVHSVALSDEEEAAVGGLVASGRYADADEALKAVLGTGLKALADDEAQRQAFIDRVNAAHDRAKAGSRAPGTAQEVLERSFARARARWDAKQGEGDAA